MFLTIFEGNRRWDSPYSEPPRKPVYLLTGFPANPSNTDIAEYYNETEKFLKMLELVEGRVDPFYVRIIFEAACHLVSGTNDIDRKKFLETCCVVQILMLCRTLYFMAMKSTDPTVVDYVRSRYESKFSTSCDYHQIKEMLLEDIERISGCDLRNW